MKKKYVLAGLMFSLGVFGVKAQQARLILNNDVYMAMAQDAQLVIDNPNPNAITVIDAGNIISEAENNNVIWNVGSQQGSYTVPFTNGINNKIPLTVQVTSAGDASGKIKFSTYATADDYNNAYPTGVTNMDEAGADNSLNVIDRFWKIEKTGYTTEPTLTYNFTYSDDATEIGGANTINEQNLKAQRYNSNLNSWETPSLLYGTVNAGANTITGVAPQLQNDYPIWAMVNAGLVGVKENTSLNNSVLVYPNPARNNFKVNFTNLIGSDNNDAQIILFDVTGKKLQTQQIKNNKQVNINVKNYSKGLYYLKIIAANKVVTKTIIIE